MKGGLAGNDDNFAALTAYVLIALLEAGLAPQVASVFTYNLTLLLLLLFCWTDENTSLFSKLSIMWSLLQIS